MTINFKIKSIVISINFLINNSTNIFDFEIESCILTKIQTNLIIVVVAMHYGKEVVSCCCCFKQWLSTRIVLAFSDKDAQRNAPIYPFSQCLKLRGMFDPNAYVCIHQFFMSLFCRQTIVDWPDFVQDALLEKLGKSVQVMHIAVDKSSRDVCHRY